jgi:hypothetical protein
MTSIFNIDDVLAVESNDVYFIVFLLNIQVLIDYVYSWKQSHSSLNKNSYHIRDFRESKMITRGP